MPRESGADMARVVGFFISLLICVSAQAQICAEVKIEIPQTVSIERQAFIAKLGVENGIAAEITEFSVELDFKDAEGNPVLFSSNPNNTQAKFFVTLSSAQGITGGVTGQGSIAGQSSAEANWLIIPSAGAGGLQPTGLLYLVGASVSYRQNNEAKVVSVLPDSITVEPQPKLKLDYFLPIDVYGDDPFTPQVEPLEPFTLGVRVKNIGAGPARQASIESAQPRIEENTLGLAVVFNIIGAYVQNEAVQNTLLTRFGEIPSQRAKMGRWLMTASLLGQFTEFDAEFTHADQLGGALTSLIDSVTTHQLVRDVLVNLPGRDSVRDFLALDGDTYRTYESELADQVVIDRSLGATIERTGTNVYRVRTTISTLPTLPVYLRVRDASEGQWQITGLSRTVDNVSLPLENVWLSKRRSKGSANIDYVLNIYDAQGTGDYLVRINSGNLSAIRGAVFRDANGNGVRDPGEVGVAAVKVTARTTIAGQAVTKEVASNALGDYGIEDLAASTYSLEVGAMPGLRDAMPIVGSLGGVPSLKNGLAQISTITLTPNVIGTDYQFAKVSTNTIPHADIAVSLATLTPSIGIAGTADITVRLKNNGPDVVHASSPLRVSFTQNGLEFVSFEPSAGTVADNVWTLPQLAVQEEASLALRVRAPVFGTRQVAAVIGTLPDFPDPVPANNIAVISISASQIPGDLTFRNGFEALGLGLPNKSVELHAAPANPRLFAGDTLGVWEEVDSRELERAHQDNEVANQVDDHSSAHQVPNDSITPTIVPGAEDRILDDRFEDH